MSKAISIAHEILQEVDAVCVMCGKRYDEIHHWPKRHKKGGAPEILYITLYPLCRECHVIDPNMETHKAPYPIDAAYLHRSREHIRRCYARGVYNA